MDTDRNQRLMQLFEQNYPAIYRRCYWVAGFHPQYHPLIEDCIQDAFLKAVSHYEDYKDYENPAGWIAITACNKLKSELRREKRKRMIFAAVSPDQLERTAISDNHIDLFWDHQEIIDRLIQIYEMLTDKEKLIFHEYFLERKKMREVAEEQGIEIGSVRSAIKRIRTRAKSTRNWGIILFFFFLYRFWTLR